MAELQSGDIYSLAVDVKLSPITVLFISIA
jgi:hypothetical protein